ncbi:hypothetical protein INS49_004242 [Diaporthe citri]|uniref:uncharacterized protein n=1 Tax=Diaporthe citri TaxID=83186 RepID=UPI001C7E2ED4|nr:uncharacterized protein INS49_004242 [Diaporthe citri]KAG6355161.1 hypothetical protein INS49_004242 [Diaporthe citri]
MRNAALMFRQTLLAVSFILIITDLLGRPTRRAPLIPRVTMMTRAIYGDPFQSPRLIGCDSEDVIPGEYMVILKGGYPLEQHMEGIGTDLSSSIDWVSSASPSLGTSYSATFDNATLTAVLKDAGVRLVECNREMRFEPLEPAIPVQELRRSPARAN